MKRKRIFTILVLVLLTCALSTTAFAIDESAAGAFGSTVSNRHSSHGTHNGGQAAGAAFTGGGNGLVGVTKRAVGNAAASSATGTGSGLSNIIGGAMFGSSLASGGKFATTTVEITNQRMASIMIHKIDAATGAGIYGVKFVLYDSGKNPIGEYTTDQDGYIYIDDELVPGKYYLRELEAADGYIRDEQYKTVYVERSKCAQIEWENSAVTGQIQIRKYSSEDNTVTGQLAGTPLEGAVFEITQARSGKVVGYIVTDARGVAASGPLPLGRYFVTEVSAPKYYQLSGEKMEAEIEYPSQIIKLSAYNKPAALGVTIKKSGNYEVQHGQAMSYDFSGIANTSNVALNHFFWHDRIPTDATRALSISTGTYNARLYYKVTFKTNLNDYRTLASNLLTSNNYSLSLNAATLRLVQGEYVTVPSGFSSVVKPTMRVQVLGTVSNGYQIINRADVGGQYLNEWQTAKTTWATTVRRFNTTPLPKTGY